MTNMFVLEAGKRDVLGKKVKHLRREDLIPAIIYGPDNDSLPIQIDRRNLRSTLIQAGGTQLIEIQVGEDKIPVLARDVQRDLIKDMILHVDFYRVAMDRLIRAEIPILLVNEPPVVSSGMAIAVQLLTSVEVESFPADLPPQIDIDISGLTKIGDHLTVAQLELGEKVIAVTGEDELIVKIDYARAPEEITDAKEEDLLFTGSAAGDVEVIRERKEDEG